MQLYCSVFIHNFLLASTSAIDESIRLHPNNVRVGIEKVYATTQPVVRTAFPPSE